MQVNILEEHGYDSALYGFSLSYKDRVISPEDWWCGEAGLVCYDCKGGRQCNKETRFSKTAKTATANAPRGKGHNKFLRQVILWLDIEAPRYWWSEMDTYKVGTVAQSESTMHTLSKRQVTTDDFEDGDVASVDYVNHYYPDIIKMKKHLPESYLQRRVLTCNYETLRNIIAQRKNHKLPEWSIFITAIMEQVAHPELLNDLLP